MSINWQELAGCGFSVFPVPLREKRSRISWKQFQKRSPTAVELAVWSKSESNAAIATGRISGIVVLDTDSPEAEAEVARCGLPETPVAKTDKGHHYYFKHPGFEVRNFARKIAGCDLRGDGGYVIAPGSIHPSGTIYTWKISPTDVPFADVPAWLLELVRGSESVPSTPAQNTSTSAYAEKALDNELSILRRSQEGTRNDTLNKAAFNLGQLVGAGALDEGHVKSHLRASARAIGLEEAEARSTIRSGLENGKQTPRLIPERVNQRQTPGGLAESATITRLDEKRAETRLLSSPLVAIAPITWYQQAVPERQWRVDDWIPDHAVTGFYGDGGVGKSLCAMQLLTACATGNRWLGQETKPCKALGFFCEDSPDELHRRQAAINRLYDLDMSDLEKLQLFSRVADDNTLMTFGADGLGQPTPLFQALTAAATKFGAQLVVIDTAADVFAGNENIRNQVRRFVSCLTRLAMAIDGAVVLCAHPSVSGIASGSGFAGSTAWNASVRSRLYLTRPESKEGAVGPEERHLTRMKANYAATGDVIQLRWTDGVFVHQDEPKDEDAPASGDKAEQAFLRCLDTLTDQGRYVTDAKNSPERYAPKVMVRMRQAAGCSMSELKRAMERSFASGAIRLDPRGPKSRNSKMIVRS